MVFTQLHEALFSAEASEIITSKISFHLCGMYLVAIKNCDTVTKIQLSIFPSSLLIIFIECKVLFRTSSPKCISRQMHVGKLGACLGDWKVS